MALITRSAVAAVMLGALATEPVSAESIDPRLTVIAGEARGVIAVIDWFYVRHRACPQPSRPVELADLQREVGDGTSIERRGQFVAIGGIAMAAEWLYYTSPDHPDHCTLWRKLGWDPALIWRRHGGTANWSFDPGDGTPERPFQPAR